MGSSGDDYSVPPQQPAPPSSMTQPFGQSTPDQGWQGMSFLGPHSSTLADIDKMQPQFAAMSAPPPGGGGGMPTQTPQQPPPDGGMTPEMREGLARLMAGAPQKQQPGIGRSNVHWVGPGGAGPSHGQGNRSDWGGSSGGH